MAQILDRLNIRKLSIEERIQLVGEIWDSIADEEGLFELTEAQRKEIERRMLTFDTSEPKRCDSMGRDRQERVIGKRSDDVMSYVQPQSRNGARSG